MRQPSALPDSGGFGIRAIPMRRGEKAGRAAALWQPTWAAGTAAEHCSLGRNAHPCYELTEEEEASTGAPQAIQHRLLPALGPREAQHVHIPSSNPIINHWSLPSPSFDSRGLCRIWLHRAAGLVRRNRAGWEVDGQRERKRRICCHGWKTATSLQSPTRAEAQGYKAN